MESYCCVSIVAAAIAVAATAAAAVTVASAVILRKRSRGSMGYCCCYLSLSLAAVDAVTVAAFQLSNWFPTSQSPKPLLGQENGLLKSGQINLENLWTRN